MTETKRPTWIRTTAVVTLIALVVGVGGGWLLFNLTSTPTPQSVWLLRAQQSTLAQGEGGAILTLVDVGPQVAKYDTTNDTITELVVGADFFNNWEERFGEEPQRVSLTGIAGAEQVEFSAEISDAVWDADSNSVVFRAQDFEDVGQLGVLLDVVVAIDGS